MLAITRCKCYNLHMTHDIAVLTGDLVASTAAGVEAVERAMDALKVAADTFSGWTGEDTRFTRFRGDGWQICVMRPNWTLRAMLFLIASLRAADTQLQTRIAIAIGPYDRLGNAGLSAASGLAFEKSGHQLDEMSRRDRIAFDAVDYRDRIAFGSRQSALGPWRGAILVLAFHQAEGWTREQAEAIALALDPKKPTQAEVAARLGITRQASQARLRGAGQQALEIPLHTFETATDISESQ